MSRPSSLIAWLTREWLLLVALTLGALLAWRDPQPLARYAHWLDGPTLAALFALLAATQAVRHSGYVQHAAWQVAGRMHGLRGLAAVTALGSAACSMVLTNDVALFLVVPLVLEIGRGLQLEAAVQRRLVVLQAFAVNAGSLLSPIGNPQNLFVWQLSGMHAWSFGGVMLPTFLINLIGLLLLTWLMFDDRRLGTAAPVAPAARDARRGWLGAGLLLATLVLVQSGVSWVAALLVLVVLLVADRRMLPSLDWALLATFAALFVALGHLAAWEPVRTLAGTIDWQDPQRVYLAGLALSQIISNVPATLFLSQFTDQWRVLLIAVNVGGYGLAIGSMANLIALRLEGSTRIWWTFHAWSVPFFLLIAVVCGVALR